MEGKKYKLFLITIFYFIPANMLLMTYFKAMYLHLTLHFVLKLQVTTFTRITFDISSASETHNLIFSAQNSFIHLFNSEMY